MSVAIMTDTNSGISPKDGEQYGIWVVSMPIIIDNKEYFEYENITTETLFNGMSIAKEVRSSQPSIGYVLEMWEKLLDDYDEVAEAEEKEVRKSKPKRLKKAAPAVEDEPVEEKEEAVIEEDEEVVEEAAEEKAE